VPNDRAPTPLAMPAYDWKLDDQQIAAVATFVRNSWGNRAAPVSADQVARLRKQLPPPHGTPAQADSSVAAGKPMTSPNPETLAPAGTDSRDNGTPQAGRAATDTALIPATHASAAGNGSGGAGPANGGDASGAGNASGAGTPSAGGGSTSASGGNASAGGGSSAGGGGTKQHQKGGHPAGVPTPGPG
jgi:hypothetical protein